MATLVLIPGLASDSIVWQPLADAMAERMPVYPADISRDASIPEMAARVLREVEGDIIAVGHSLGGRVAMDMARRAPDRIVGLVLANTGQHPKRDGEEIKRQQMIDLGHEDIGRLADAWLPPMLDPARVSDAVLVNKLKAMVMRVGADVHERQIRSLVARPDASAYLPQITCPILFVAANQDGFSPVAQHQEMADAAPDSELAIVDHAGHFAPVEQPEAVVTAITGWLGRRFGEAHA
ncbi:alpha/beta fold hydrolase [Oryzicola mucosus]|uniref:Alpha/beta fold hydrolase n=1 Tax=Oryzicola mucosus TaxID=2767425 RepID=A0A8J6U846_9HYPH|nr:alpha/beta fold hydrolase [Oryzicola mucosus]MBD0415347.1 alpha/beta fold hydrolase [Oryzicola mucosus]